jgi:myo-inositol-1(or 4)-monophosphatase
MTPASEQEPLSFRPADLDTALSDADLAAALVQNAGWLALRMRGEGLHGERKTSVSDVVTAADRAAEEYVLSQLERCRPDDGILGEEGASRNGSSGRTWVIDPVDGTYNFLSGSTYWCSALALQQATDSGNRRILLGAIFQPEEDKLWLGGEGVPATLNGEPLPGPRNEPINLLSAATYLDPQWLGRPSAAAPWTAAALLPATLRMNGSGSCDLARVADGGLGSWFQHSCPDWDWLPGKAIVEASGGSTAVLDVGGLTWFVAGGATAVGQLRDALSGVAHKGTTGN